MKCERQIRMINQQAMITQHDSYFLTMNSNAAISQCFYFITHITAVVVLNWK